MVQLTSIPDGGRNITSKPFKHPAPSGIYFVFIRISTSEVQIHLNICCQRQNTCILTYELTKYASWSISAAEVLQVLDWQMMQVLGLRLSHGIEGKLD